MKHLDLFSGIGGFALAAKWLGIETVAFCEIEEFCQKVLKKNFPHIPIHKDVRNTDEFEQYRGVNLVSAGYPCQPFSVAGLRKGEDDDRHLWPSVLEIIKRLNPEWFLGENVAGHINMGLDEVLFDLESQGYTARPIVIPACAVNALHRRDRVWILAHNSGGRRKGSRQNTIQGKRGLSGVKDGGRAPALKELRDIHSPWLCRTSNGVSNRLDRTRGLGNAIVPQVAYEIMKAMINQ